jgi:hypothetical protein
MDKPQLNYNEYLRYTFAGGVGILSFLYLNPKYFDNLFQSEGIKDSLFLILSALIIGSFIYAFHRAIIYPIIYKINLFILTIFRQLNFDLGLLQPFTSSKLERDMDFRRWKQRQNPKSFAKELLDWSAQIHFLYCCVIAIFIVKLFSTQSNNVTISYVFDKGQAPLVYKNILRNWHLVALLIVAMINHIRSLVYDIELSQRDVDYENYSTETQEDVTRINSNMSALINRVTPRSAVVNAEPNSTNSQNTEVPAAQDK